MLNNVEIIIIINKRFFLQRGGKACQIRKDEYWMRTKNGETILKGGATT